MDGWKREEGVVLTGGRSSMNCVHCVNGPASCRFFCCFFNSVVDKGNC